MDAIDLIQQQISILIRRSESERTAKQNTDRLDRSAYLMLGFLVNEGTLTVGQLAEFLQLDISTASRQVRALEDKGLVARTPDPRDGRISRVSLTEEGQQRFLAAKSSRLRRYRQLLSDWSEPDLAQFGAYLVRLNQAYYEAIHNSSPEQPGERKEAGR